MNKSTDEYADRLITTGEIAEVAGVGPSAVSNWRRRRSDFPPPAEETPSGDLFRYSEVVRWLEANGKTVRRLAKSTDRIVWDLADVQRGSSWSGEGPQTLLQLLYLKCVSHGRIPEGRRYADLWAQMLDRPEGALGLWKDTVHNARDEDEILARALRPNLAQEGASIGTLIEKIDQVDLDLVSPGELSIAILKGVLGSRGAWRESYTPPNLTDIMVGLLEPLSGTVYDPACGAGLFLSAAWNHRHAGNLHLSGQELNEGSWRLGFLNLSLQGANFSLKTGDTLQDDQFWSLQADRIALDPPLGSMAGTRFSPESDPRWRHGVPPKRGSDFAWIQHLLFHLAEGGIGVAVVSSGALFRSAREREIRESILQSRVLDAVIQLPGGVLAGTSIPSALLVFQRGRENRDSEVLFLDAVQLGRPERGGVREFGPGDVERIVGTVRAWREGSFSPEPQFSASATIDEVLLNQDAVLSPNRYVTYALAETEIGGEPIETRFLRIVDKLTDQKEEIVNLASSLTAQLSRWEFSGGRTREERVRLGDILISEPRTGMRQDDAGPQSPIPFVGTADVSSGASSLRSAPSETTTAYKDNRLLHWGDILLVSRGIDSPDRIGCATVRLDGPVAYSQSLIRLRIDPKRAKPDFIRLFFKSRQGGKALVAVTSGSTISNLRPSALKEIEIPLPPLEEQDRIVEELLVLEAKLSELDTYLQGAKDVHDTLREGLASGMVTLKEEESQ